MTGRDEQRPDAPTEPDAADETTIEAIYAAALSGDPTPSGFETVGIVLAALRHPGTEIELATETSIMAMFVTEREQRLTTHNIVVALAPPSSPRPTSSPRISRRTAVLVAGSVFMLSGVAAAVTGNLPGPVQRFVHDGLAHVALSVPDDPTRSTPHQPGTSSVGQSCLTATDPTCASVPPTSAPTNQANHDSSTPGDSHSAPPPASGDANAATTTVAPITLPGGVTVPTATSITLPGGVTVPTITTPTTPVTSLPGGVTTPTAPAVTLPGGITTPSTTVIVTLPNLSFSR